MNNIIKNSIFILLLFLVNFSVNGQQIIFEDDFESGNFKAQWTASPGVNDGVVGVFELFNGNNIAQEGFYGVAIGKNSDGDFNLNTLDLRLDLSAYTQVELSFWINDFRENNHGQDGIYFSEDGGQNFVKVFAFDAEGWTDFTYGQLPPLDIDKLAITNGLNLTSQFVIRFQQYGEHDFLGVTPIDGYFIDDVQVRVPSVSYATLPFFDDFENATLGNSWKWAHPFIDGLTTNDIKNVRPGGLVNLEKNEDFAYSGFNYVAIGRRNDGLLTTNALDLHLDLSGLTNAELSFFINDYREENHSLDGIYFSDNGGESFSKVYAFDQEGWTDFNYGQLPPLDIDKLASANGLNLTAQFVIRFQQHDEHDFSGVTPIDGFFLDDIEVKVPEIEYANLPFSDDFEKPILDRNWKWNHPFIDGQTTDNINDVRPGGVVGLDVNQDLANSGFNYVFLGRRNDGLFTTNALDLYLNATNVSNAELSFFINDYRDENHSLDGIYFSDNGGQDFTKVYAFDFEALDDFSYHEIKLDINALASNNNVNLSAQFVIRFQQYDEHDFSGVTPIDGVLIDDVQICVDDNCSPAPPSTINLAVSNTPEGCSQNNGTATVTATDGIAPYSYNWNNSQTGATINNLSAGVYMVTVTDNTGATATASTTVQNNGVAPTADFTFSVTANTVTFQSNNTTGCTWDFGDGNTAATCNTSHTYAQNGTYSVALTTQNACGDDRQVKEIIINEVSNNCEDFSVGIATSPIDGCLRSFKLVPSDGSAPYTFLWRDGQTTDSIAYDISVTPDYAFTVTDSEGCVFTGGNTATCTPTNNNSDDSCSDEDMAFLIGEWTGTFDQLNPSVQSSMTMEIISVEDGLFLGAMVRPDILSEARIVVGTCRNDSIWWSETVSLEDLDLMGLYLSEPGEHTSTTIDGDYFNTDPAEFAGTFSLSKNCDYPIAAFTTNIGANGQVQFQNNSQNNPLAQFWEFGDGGEDFIVNPSHTYTSNGTYEVSLVVSNGCGSRGDDTLRQTIIIDNIGGTNTQTVRLYAGEVEGSAGDQVLLPIRVENLDTITVLEGQIQLDNPAIGRVIGVQPGAIDVGTINLTNLSIGYFASNGIGVALNPTDTLFYLVVELTGNPEDRSLVMMPDFEIYGAFSGNTFNALPYDTQDGVITITGNFEITGRVQTFDNSGIANTNIELAITLPDGSQDTKNSTTQSDGSYAFQDIPAGSTCVLMPAKDTDVQNGLSTAALFLGQRYILGLPAPQISSPFQLFAGDVNCDNRFSTVDLFLIQKVLVEIDDSFADCPGSWDFTPEVDRNLFNSSLNYHDNGAVNKTLSLTPAGDVTADFIGVKKGDLLNLANPANLLNELAESRATQTLPLKMVKTVTNNKVDIAFYPTQSVPLASYQLAFNFEESQLAFVETIAGHTAPLANIAADGTLLMSWFTPSGTAVLLDENQPIFKLQFTKKEKITNDLKLATQRMPAIGFDNNLEKWALTLATPYIVDTPFQLYQNRPNPFNATTLIRFDLPVAMPATLVLTNNLGQVVQKLQSNYEQGQNVIQLSAHQLPKGLYYYTLSTTQFSATKRLIVID